MPTQAALRISVWTQLADLDDAGTGSAGKYTATAVLDSALKDEAQYLASFPFTEDLLAPWSASGAVTTGADSKIAFGAIATIYARILYILGYANRFYLDGADPPDRNDTSEPRYHITRRGADFYLWGPDDYASLASGLTLYYIPIMTDALVQATANPLLKALIYGAASRVCRPTEGDFADELEKLREREKASLLPQPQGAKA